MPSLATPLPERLHPCHSTIPTRGWRGGRGAHLESNIYTARRRHFDNKAQKCNSLPCFQPQSVSFKYFHPHRNTVDPHNTYFFAVENTAQHQESIILKLVNLLL